MTVAYAVGTVTRNLITSPSAETGVTSWTATSLTLTSDSAARWVGANSFKYAVTTVDNFMLVYTGASATDPARMVVTPGALISGSARLLSVARINAKVYLQVNFYNDANALMGFALTDPLTMPVGAWVTITAEGLTVPAGSTWARFYIRFVNDAVIQVGDVFRGDGIHVHEGATATKLYVDGDQPFSAWAGTAHASTSTRVEPDLANRNLVPNPSVETNLTGWTSDATVGGVTQTWTRNTAQPWVGVYAARNEITANTAAAGQATRYTHTNIAISPGHYYAFSAVSYRQNTDLTPRLQATWFDAGGNFIAAPGDIREIEDPAQASPTRHELSLQQAPDNAAYCKVVLLNTFAVPNALGIVDWDGVQVQQAERFDWYKDGDQPNVAWLGTPHASISLYIAPLPYLPRGTGGNVSVRTRVYLTGADGLQHTGGELGNVTSGFIEYNIDRLITGNGQITLDGDPGLDPLRDFLRIEQTLYYQDERPGRAYRLAQMVVTGQGEGFDGTPRVGSYTLADLTYLMARNAATVTRNYLATTKHVTVARGAALESGIPADRIILPDHPGTLGTPRSYGVGTTALERANIHLKAIGYTSFYGSRLGYVTAHPYVNSLATAPAATYAAGDGSALIGSVQRNQDLDGIANVIIVVRDSTIPAQILTAVRRNDDPTSPVSTVSLGREITLPGGAYVDAQLADQAAVDATADQQMESASNAYVNLAMQTGPEPWHDPFEVYGVTVEDGGEWITGNWRVGTVRHDLSEMIVDHQLRRHEPYIPV